MKQLFATLILFSIFSANHASAADVTGEKDQSQNIIANYEGGKVTLKDANEEIQKLAAQNEKMKGLTFEKLTSDQKEMVIKEVVTKRMAVCEAKKRDLDDDKDYKEALKLFEAELLKQKLFITLAKEAGEAENVRKNYDELVMKLKDKKDIKISYIIVKTQAEAQSIYNILLKYPNSFASMARKKSLDRETGRKGGDLGFVMEDLLPSEILTQARSVSKGQIAAPVASKDKWVIVKLDDEKPVEITSFEKSKENLAQNLAKKAIDNFVAQSLEKAKITIILK